MMTLYRGLATIERAFDESHDVSCVLNNVQITCVCQVRFLVLHTILEKSISDRLRAELWSVGTLSIMSLMHQQSGFRRHPEEQRQQNYV